MVRQLQRQQACIGLSSDRVRKALLLWAISSLTHPTDMRSGSCRQTTELVLDEWKSATLRAAVLRFASCIRIPGACGSDAFRAVLAKPGFHQSMDRVGD